MHVWKYLRWQDMNKSILYLVFVCVLHTNIYAQQRNRTECAQIAIDLGYTECPIEVPPTVIPRAKAFVKCSPFYIFNDTINNRFAIVSGDKRMQPILGYGEGTFNSDNIPIGLVEMLNSYSKDYDFAQNLPYVDDSEHKVNARSKSTPISPLIKSVWGQGIPFNNNTPRLGKYDRTASGCVATAMAQIMKYYNYPSSGKGFYSYTTRTHNLKVEEDFSTTIFDWGDMINSYRGNFTQNQGAAVATLMKSCGVSVDMDYDKASGAYSSDVPYAMINNFGYNPNIQYYLKQYFSDEEWETIIMNELNNGRPMLYSAVDSKEGGHAFILDGTDGNGLFHFNWGWEGSHDGYFAINALVPNTYKYTSDHSIVCHIQPEETEKKEDVFCASSFNCSQMEASNQDKFQFILNSCYCYANTTSYARDIFKNWDFTVGIYDSEDNLIQLGEIISRKGKSQYSVGRLYLSIKPDITVLNPDLAYYIKPIVSQAGANDYSVVRTAGGENNLYKLTIKGNKFSINEQLERTFTEAGIMYQVTSFSERTVTVMKGDYHAYVNVPEHIIHEGVEYTITAIGSKAFMQRYELKEVTFPSTIISVGSWCFDGCNSLEKIVCLAQTPPICEFYVTYPFDDVAATATLYVPHGSKEAYMLAEGWCDFMYVVELDEVETSITDAREQMESGIFFSIDGTRFERMDVKEIHKSVLPGIYIINGKKYLLNEK